jgi:hypothetical protein
MKLNSHLAHLVRPDGQLDTSSISLNEPIYTAKSGKSIERFRFAQRSYIFKPCSYQAVSRELWMQEYLKPCIPAIRVPDIAASGQSDDGTSGWIIYEDLGQLVHLSEAIDVIKAAAIIPLWHRLEIDLVPPDLSGHTPYYSDVLKILTNEAADISKILGTHGVPVMTTASWLEQLKAWDKRIRDHCVISHGDYYPLNIAFQGAESIVLDWEFAHVNSVYWDLYSLMDITSPRYKGIYLRNADREAALDQYWQAMQGFAAAEHYNEFVQGYYVFTSAYSAWILGLIEMDLRLPTALHEELLRQQQETVYVFKCCLHGLGLCLVED